MTKKQFVLKEIKDRDLSMRNHLVKEMAENCISASDILTKKELTQMMDDYEWTYGPKLFS